MKRNLQGTEWFLTGEGLRSVVAQIPAEPPGRRGYWTCDWAGKQVFVKFFLEKGLVGFFRNRFMPRGRREYELGQRLTALGIPTPRSFGYGLSKRGSFVIQEYMAGRSLLETLKEQNLTEERVGALAGLLLALRRHRIRHNDLHCGNILVTEDGLCLIDLHKTRIKRSFSSVDEISNISQALSSLYRDMDEKLRALFFRSYGILGLRPLVEAELERMRQRWVDRKKERAFRNTSKIVRSGDTTYLANGTDQPMGQFVTVLKEDRKVRVERYTDHIRKVYKGRRRMERAWKAGVVLAYMDLSITPKIFYMKRSGGLDGSYIAMEDLGCKGEELDRFLDRRYDVMEWKERRRFVEGLSRFFIGLMKRGVCHKDMKACNIFAMYDGSFKLLDVEDIVFQHVTANDLKRLLIQLNTSVPKRITARDRIRCFVRVVALLGADKRNLFKEVARESFKRPIIYEGVSGLVRENW